MFYIIAALILSIIAAVATLLTPMLAVVLISGALFGGSLMAAFWAWNRERRRPGGTLQ